MDPNFKPYESGLLTVEERDALAGGETEREDERTSSIIADAIAGTLSLFAATS